MSRKRIIELSVLIIIAVAVTAAILFISRYDDQSQYDEKYGNTSGNISNYGLVRQSGDWIYYINFEDEQRLYKVHIDGTKKQKLGSLTNCTDINVKGNWIYFVGGSNGRDIYKVRTDGAQQIRLTDGKKHGLRYGDVCRSVNVVDDWIYYINGIDNQAYKIRTDGNDRQRVLGVNDCNRIIIYDNWVYYSGKDGGLYRRHTDNVALFEKITGDEDRVYFFSVFDNWIYYNNREDNWHIYKIRTDGSGRECLNQVNSQGINIADDWIYYRNADDHLLHIYRIRMDGSEGEKLNDEKSYNLNIYGDWVYYTILKKETTTPTVYEMDELWKMRLDGSERQKMD